MTNSNAKTCPFFHEGKCEGKDLKLRRMNYCSSKIRNMCCSLCKTSGKCKAKCDFWQPQIEETSSQPLPTEKRVKVSYEILLRVHVTTGLILLASGFILAYVFSSTETNLFTLLQSYWKLNTPSTASPFICTLLLSLVPYILIGLGTFLSVYGSLRMITHKQKRTTR